MSINWKTTTIMAIPKIEKSKNANEYRIHQCVTNIRKSIRISGKKQLEKFVEHNDIIREHQSDFTIFL